MKQKYCPVCLKVSMHHIRLKDTLCGLCLYISDGSSIQVQVYRDSEPLPMVCCDICEHWVHIGCDGIRYDAFLSTKSLKTALPLFRKLTDSVLESFSC